MCFVCLPQAHHNYIAPHMNVSDRARLVVCLALAATAALSGSARAADGDPLCVARPPPFQPITFNTTLPVATSCFDKFWSAGHYRYYFSVSGAAVHTALYSAGVVLLSQTVSDEYVAGDAANRTVVDGNFTVARFAKIVAMIAFSSTSPTTRVLYVMDSRRIRRLDLLGQTVSTVAGTGAEGYASGAAASFYSGPTWFDFGPVHDGNDLYVSQPSSYCVRLLDTTTGRVGVADGICGSPRGSSAADRSTKFASPGPLLVTALTGSVRSIYVADAGEVILTGTADGFVTHATYTGEVAKLVWSKSNGEVVGLMKDHPCEVFRTRGGAMTRYGTFTPSALCVGQPQEGVAFDLGFILSHGGNVSRPLWGIEQCTFDAEDGVQDEASGHITLSTGVIIAIAVGAVIVVAIVVAVAVGVRSARGAPTDDGVIKPVRGGDGASAVMVGPREPTHTTSSGTGTTRSVLSARTTASAEGAAATSTGERSASKQHSAFSTSQLRTTPPPPDFVGGRMKPAVVDASLFTGDEMVIANVSQGDFHPHGDPVLVALEMQKHNDRCTAVAAGAYQKGKLMGRGANGSVYSVLLTNGSTVAMKEVGLKGSCDEIAKQTVNVEREMKMLSTLRHPNIVMYYGAVVDREHMQVKLFMELVTGGSLGSLVRNQRERMSEEPVKRFMVQIVEGLSFIHERGFVHRDLKSDNVLIDTATGCIKLADFGTAKSVGDVTNGADTVIGTPLFMAPEISAPMMEQLDSRDVACAVGYGKKADVWSLGIMAVELLDQGKLPWPNFVGAGHAFMHISSEQGIPIVPDGISDEAARFIQRCTQRDPHDRPSVVELKFDPWLL
jgi:tRNA A-37 threonylcarbamoyl transferase component Bud32